jgi:iron complex transport system ATP-binding protein
LTVQGIEFAYSSAKILDDVNFEATPGEIVGILGPNGSGKTTLLKCINHALHPRAGTVLVEGKSISEMTRREIATEMGVVPQNSGVNFPFTALEIVLMGRGPSLRRFQAEGEKDLEIARKAMEATDVVEFAGRLMTELSGGEKQRVIIARALAQQPKILLLDEPTLHLDVNHQIEILELVRDLVKSQMLTAVIVSHDLNLAARYCDKLILLEKGQVIAAGQVQQVLTSENMAQVFRIKAAIDYDPRINAYSISILNSIDRKIVSPK